MQKSSKKKRTSHPKPKVQAKSSATVHGTRSNNSSLRRALDYDTAAPRSQGRSAIYHTHTHAHVTHTRNIYPVEILPARQSPPPLFTAK